MGAWVLTLLRLPLAAGFAVAVAVLACRSGALTGGATAGLLALVAASEITDALDGWVARRQGRQSRLGGLVDPLCDSLARLTMYFALALAGWVWIGVPLAMAGRDIVVAYVRVVLALGGGPTSARTSGKAKAIVQGAGLVALVLLAGPWVRGEASSHDMSLYQGGLSWYRGLVSSAVLLVTLWSLVDYVRAGWPAARRMARAGPS